MADIFRKALNIAAGLFKTTDAPALTSTMEPTAKTPIHEADPRNSDSDADDEDFNPDAIVQEVVSEEGSEDESPGKSGRKSKKRRKTGAKLRTGKKRRKVDADSDSDSDDDFVLDSSQLENSSDEVLKASPEEEAVQEALEKAETDRLWASFLTDVEAEKERRKSRGQTRTIEKVVDKVVDFAGEKMTVQETIKVTVSGSNGAPSSSTSKFPSSEVNRSSASSGEEPVPGPSKATKGNSKPRVKRGGISILGNDPELIGLDDLDKRGLSGLIKAFQNKEAAAAAKRIGTLEKSKLDWEQYKRKTGLEEELTHHNRSRDTYIDKQEFLQRADLRQFEIEKSMRATQRSKRLANN